MAGSGVRKNKKIDCLEEKNGQLNASEFKGNPAAKVLLPWLLPGHIRPQHLK